MIMLSNAITWNKVTHQMKKTKKTKNKQTKKEFTRKMVLSFRKITMKVN